MTTHADLLNQTFPAVSTSADGEVHRRFHTPTHTNKSNNFNFEQQLLFDNAFHSVSYQPATTTVSCQQITSEHLDRLCYSPRVTFATRNHIDRPSKPEVTLSMIGNTRFNPFRAFLIVNRNNSTIVGVNRQACEYFWFTEDELKSKTIDDLIIDEKCSSVISDSFLSQLNGQTKILAGKIVQVRIGTGERAQFSLFIQDLDGNENPFRFYAFEPIDVIQTKFICSKQGFIESADENFHVIFHNSMSERKLSNEKQNIAEIIPTLKDETKFQQLLTHRAYRTTGLLNSEKNLFIPLMINLSKKSDDDENLCFTISIMSNISGLIILDENFTVRAYNPYFVQSLLAYRSLELINHHVTEILPEFNEFGDAETTNLSMNISNDFDLANLSYQSLLADDEINSSGTSSNTLNDSSLETTPKSARLFRSIDNKKSFGQNLPTDKRLNNSVICSFKTATSTPLGKPNVLKNENKTHVEEPSVFLQSVAKHKNGSLIGVVYSLKRLDLADGSFRYSLWLSRDNTDPKLIEIQKSFDFNHSHLIVDDLSSSIFNQSINSANEQNNFESKYVITRQRGRGGYGQVYLGHEKNDEEKQVVIKFIKKTKIKLHRYVESFQSNAKILFEVAILKQLDHRNVVQILDAFDTENYVQMVMPLHGQGIDLYEFVEKGARIDENLASYIFRQLVDAVDYLHRNHIAHQDIKDENLIINEKYHIKLIDFGSAISITQPDMYTSSFGGTTEFCCPEFFQKGSCQPFLADIWAMMVTLYVIIFRRYPFSNPDEIKRCQLDLQGFQSRISEDLYDLLSSTLVREPCQRLTMREIQQHDWLQQPFHLEAYPWETVTQNSLEETFLTGNHLVSGDDENNPDQSFSSLTRQIQTKFNLVEKPKTKKVCEEIQPNEKNLFAYLNCKHASI